ncbi:uncharacterized protein LOC116771254 [Danaus plexippus]|uniref:uncharacterized protein LOC116771254 n=1 Tax=Danaus plexippus TaxID=13037 RepID=UPI002AAF266F|nr:uncharacterized protein LOC116771254 [Danaus plexippus]XP_032518947.2 uncharacterized protein LOC116771254 [Danaus plexippus]
MSEGGAVLEAAARGDAGRVASLLRAGEAHHTDENGCSALQRAAADGHVEVVRVLLQHGADPLQRDIVHGNTAIHEAAWKGYSRTVGLLSRSVGSVVCRNAAGFTPLHLAAQNGHNQSARELLLAGANPDIQNNYGDTSLHTAARYGHAGVTRILISAQCQVSEQNKNGDTALHIAAAMGRRKLTRILLEAGCDKSIKNHQGETARDIAMRKGLDEIIHILNTPVAKQNKKKEKHRDKSRERTIDEPDDGKKRDKSKDKKKRSVHFETPPQVQWSPYGCHYYPDPKYFPKPKLNSLPTEPLKKGEQYYLDLAGNIKKGPIGAGYTCYCAPFFKHMEDKLNEDKNDLKRHIDRAHEKLDQKVTDLEMKTQGKISELTRFMAAERAMCKERHKHLELWLTRGMTYRASERVKKLDFSPKGSLDIPTIKRTRSLELLDANNEDWNNVNRIIRDLNENAEQCETIAKELDYKATSRSTDGLDTQTPSSPRRKNILKNSRSSDQLDAGPSRSSRSSHSAHINNNDPQDTAENYGNSNRVSISQSPETICNERFMTTSQQLLTNSLDVNKGLPAHGPQTPEGNIDHFELQNESRWKSQVLQKTADDVRKRVMFEKETSNVQRNKNLDISQDGYIKITNPEYREDKIDREPRKSVLELVAEVEHQQKCTSPERPPLPKKKIEKEVPVSSTQPSQVVLKMPQQPLRPAPALKEKPPKSKRFSLHNLIPFPTRKTFQTPPKQNENNSESSDEEDAPIRSINQPGPMKNTNLLQTLPLPNYEMVSTSQPPALPTQTHNYPHDIRMIPKDAYFHDISNRKNDPYKTIDNGLPYLPGQYDYEPGPVQNQIRGRNRNPIYQTGVFSAMMQDHIIREIERIPHKYGDRLDQDTEIEIANRGHYRGYDNDPSMYYTEHSLHGLQSLAINTNITETHSQADRESHNDSGYSTKVYGSSQGPSPSLSGPPDDKDRATLGASSLV